MRIPEYIMKWNNVSQGLYSNKPVCERNNPAQDLRYISSVNAKEEEGLNSNYLSPFYMEVAKEYINICDKIAKN